MFVELLSVHVIFEISFLSGSFLTQVIEKNLEGRCQVNVGVVEGQESNVSPRT
jgi:hypothetical protein